MPLSKITTPTALAGTLVKVVADSDGSYNNVTGNTSGKVYQVKIDNSRNIDQGVYVKYVDSASATPGSSTADMMFYVNAGKSCTYIVDTGFAYTSGVSLWISSVSGTNNISSPSSAVTITLLAT